MKIRMKRRRESFLLESNALTISGRTKVRFIRVYIQLGTLIGRANCFASYMFALTYATPSFKVLS